MTGQNSSVPASKGAKTRSLRWGDELPDAEGLELSDLYDKSWAVVIGINDYSDQHPRLVNARNDAEGVAKILKETFCFDKIIPLCDEQATQQAILEYLRDDLPTETGPNDRVIFFFAGHGVTHPRSGQGFLVPYGARQGKYSDYVDMDELRKACQAIAAKHILVILDCCFSGVAAVTSRSTPTPPPPLLTDTYLKRITEQKAWQILTAGDTDDQVADSGLRPGHSAFTSALLEGLEGGADTNVDGIITATELANYVKPEVTRHTGDRGQMPFFNYLASSKQGDFVFLRPGEKVVLQPEGIVQREVKPLLWQYPWLWVVGVIIVIILVALGLLVSNSMTTSNAQKTEIAKIHAALTQGAAQATRVQAEINKTATVVANAPAAERTAVQREILATQTFIAEKEADLAVTLTAISSVGQPEATPSHAPTATIGSTPTEPPSVESLTSTTPPDAFQCRITEEIGTVNVRTGPGVAFEPVRTLQPNDVVTILAWSTPSDQPDQAWFQVITSNNQEGWIASRPYPDLGRDYDCNFDLTAPFPFERATSGSLVQRPTPTPKGMVLVPAGEFTMGNGTRVKLDDFYIDLHEVTNVEFAACVKIDVCDKPSSTRSNKRENYYDNPEYDDYPVINVNWYQARDYCEWVGKSLPTEAQWEKAARGTDNRTYPWGEGRDCHKANYWYSISEVGLDCVVEEDTTKVGSYPEGVSPYGIYDMIGNVWEWTLTEINTRRVFRGGSWRSSDNYVVPATSRVDREATESYDDVGFRCIKD